VRRAEPPQRDSSASRPVIAVLPPSWLCRRRPRHRTRPHPGCNMRWPTTPPVARSSSSEGTTRSFSAIRGRWDGIGWTMMRPAHAPSARTRRGDGVRPSHGEVVLFGGVWRRDRAQTTHGRGTVRTGPNAHPFTAPSGRYGSAMAIDAGSGQVLLFGGATIGGDLLSDTCGHGTAPTGPRGPPRTFHRHAPAWDGIRRGAGPGGGCSAASATMESSRTHGRGTASIGPSEPRLTRHASGPKWPWRSTPPEAGS
jgi:hypothetical protein